MKLKLFVTAFALVLFVPALPAQNAQPTATIQQRKDNQQERIGQGMESGQLTAGEAARIEKQESRLNRQERRMKADGNFTRSERQRIQKKQNALSREIYREKHDAARQAPANGRINSRKDNQQERIGQGLQSGQLTAGEAAKLEHREANLNRRQARMAASGGKLTQGERNALNKQQNAISEDIYRTKHNNKQRPQSPGRNFAPQPKTPG
jgi:hypothetical protein